MARISDAIGYDVEVSEPNGLELLRKKGIKVAQVQVGDF